MKMTSFRKDCKFCNSGIDMSNRNGWWYPCELAGDLDNCFRRRKGN